jgi:glycosyltransferase involved in cell wall biosynthesis
MNDNSRSDQASPKQTILLAVMNLENLGGVADQITNLAIELPRYQIRPIVLVRNPLSAGQSYATLIRRSHIRLWAIDESAAARIVEICRVLQLVAYPIILLDALARRKSVSSSKNSVWGVLRRAGYAGLDAIFWLRLLQARVIDRARIVHFRNPDCWPKIAWAKWLGFRIMYTEDVVPRPETADFYHGLAKIKSHIDAITACSAASARALVSYLGTDIHVAVIPYMVQDHQSGTFLPGPLSQPQIRIGSLSRLAPQKDIRTLILAASNLSKRNNAMRFLIYGDGPLRDALIELTSELGLDDIVVFKGAYTKRDLPAVLSGIDIVVQSSIYEGLPVAILEAMSFGKPVVATAVDGVPEAILDGVTGFLVPPESPDRVADAILTLAQDRQLYACMAKAARERYLACYTPERIMSQYLAVYEQARGARALSEEQ